MADSASPTDLVADDFVRTDDALGAGLRGDFAMIRFDFCGEKTKICRNTRVFYSASTCSDFLKAL
jgi:hypothetical protein